MSTSNRLLLIGLLGAFQTLHAAPVPHNINASAIGTGGLGRAIDWNTESAQSPVWCGTTCSYIRVSTAKVAPDSAWTFKPIVWPGTYVTSFPNPVAVERAPDSTQGTTDAANHEIVYNFPWYERAAVDVYRDGQSLTAKVLQSGNQVSARGGATGTAAAALAYHVQVQNLTGEGRDYFIRFTAPPALKGVNVAYYISQYQQIPIKQEYGKSRSAVDILVNGLPVWSTAANYFFPDDYDGSANGGFRTDWGYASDNDQYTVFIGRFAAGETLTVDFIVRADSFARAPQCGTENEPANGPTPRVLKHCYLITAGRELPASPGSAQERFEIYSKMVSTAPVIPSQLAL